MDRTVSIKNRHYLIVMLFGMASIGAMVLIIHWPACRNVEVICVQAASNVQLQVKENTTTRRPVDIKTIATTNTIPDMRMQHHAAKGIANIQQTPNIVIPNQTPNKDIPAASKPPNTVLPNITLMVRTDSSPALLTRFYCMYLRTVSLFWPFSYGSMALILDAESTSDHLFGDKFIKQMQRLHPQVPVKIHYEQLPKNRAILSPLGNWRGEAYNRQLWSTFFADKYTNEPIVAYMDTDSQIVTPLTRNVMFNGNKPKVFGEGTKLGWIGGWESSTVEAIGLPMIVNFMITFPQLIYRDTYTNCRNFILKRLKTDDFEVAFSKFFHRGSIIAPINIIMSYAWFHEYDRYDWHIKTRNLQLNNIPLPQPNKIHPQDIIPSIVGVAHISDKKSFNPELMIPGYCMSVKATGRSVSSCRNITHSLNLLCDYWETFFRYPWPAADKWCKAGNMNQCCHEAMVDHYKDVAILAKENVFTFKKEDVYLVDEFAEEMNVTCPKVYLP